MPVSHDDVRAIVALARLDVPAGKLDALAVELNGILSHMAVLARVEGGDAAAEAQAASPGMRLAPDRGPSVPLEHAPERGAPLWRDGFFLVPRLDTHDSAGATGTDEP